MLFDLPFFTKNIAIPTIFPKKLLVANMLAYSHLYFMVHALDICIGFCGDLLMYCPSISLYVYVAAEGIYVLASVR